MDLLDALVESRGRVAAAQALGVNYRTMMSCYDSRRVSLRMRRALREFRDSTSGEGEDVGTEGWVQALVERAAELEEENRELRELVEAQANQIDELQHQVAALEGEQAKREAERVDAAGKHELWRPLPRASGPPDASVVTLEKVPGEEDALGPAEALVEKWRELRNPAARRSSRVDRARADVRRWELEVTLLRDFHLTLPLEVEPLDDSRRADHIRWRLEALAEAVRELAQAVRGRWLRRAVTLGLWWN